MRFEVEFSCQSKDTGITKHFANLHRIILRLHYTTLHYTTIQLHSLFTVSQVHLKGNRAKLGRRTYMMDDLSSLDLRMYEARDLAQNLPL